MMNLIRELNSNEKKALEELQARMKNTVSQEERNDIAYFYRFLKARNFDVEKAEMMLRKNLMWRKSHQVDTILRDFKPKEAFTDFIEASRVGFDKDGDLILYFPGGKADAKAAFKCVKLNDIINHWVWFIEKHKASLKEIREKTGRELPKVVFIIDLDKLSLLTVISKINTEASLRVISMFCDNYPEFLKSAYIINAPSYFVLLFSLVKAVMSHEMLQKIQFFGQDGWKQKLLNIIDADVLPAFLGGKKEDPDGNPMCNTFIKHGGKIPEILYLAEEDRFFKDPTRVEKITIPPSSKTEVEINIEDCKSLIQWEFQISNKDIGFGLLYKAPDKEEIEELLPIQRYDTIDGTEEGQYNAQLAGKYIIVFDNSFSRMTSKKVEYCITISKQEMSRMS